MATVKSDKTKEYQYSWTGKDKAGKIIKGDTRGPGEASVSAHLRRQGITVTKIKKTATSGGKVTEKDITLFTRQLATMLKSGVPLLQAFDIVGKGHDNPAVARLLLDIKTDVETGSSLQQSFRKFPLYFDDLYCNLLGVLRPIKKRSLPSKARSNPLCSTRFPSLSSPLSLLRSS